MILWLKQRPHILCLLICLFSFGISGSSQETKEFKKAPVMKQQIPFNHSRSEHKQPCSSCHVRANDDTEPAFPYHTACVNCHVPDFMSQSSRLCQNCHIMPLQEVKRANALPTARMVTFTKQMEEFGLKSFSHRDHLDPAKMPRKVSLPQCTTCHSFDSQNLAASIPSHPECYQCHEHKSTGRLGKCETCHAFKNQSLVFEKGPSAPYYLFKFTHSAHFKVERIGPNCALCHQIKKEKTIPDIVRIEMKQDGVDHNTSCWSAGCHVNVVEKDCFRCHITGKSWPARNPWKWKS